MSMAMLFCQQNVENFRYVSENFHGISMANSPEQVVEENSPEYQASQISGGKKEKGTTPKPYGFGKKNRGQRALQKKEDLQITYQELEPEGNPGLHLSFTIKSKHVDIADLITQARAHSTWPEVKEVMDLAGLTNKEMAHIMGVSDRHLIKSPHTRLTTSETEKLICIRNLFEEGLAFFGGKRDYVNRWLKTPNEQLITADKDFLRLETAYTPPPVEKRYHKTKPDLLAAAIKNRQDLKELAQQKNWPDKPYPTPLSLLDTIVGIQLVGTLLSRMTAGVYS